MNFPSPPMAEILDTIKETDKSSTVPTVYRITKVSARSDGSASVVCDTEIVYGYDDLCIKMFDLDVSCWEISEGITVEPHNSNIGILYNLVTIKMARTI